MGIVVLLGPVSGSHFNPAVTLGVYFHESTEKIKNLPFLIMIIVSQIIGGTIGVLIVALAIYRDPITHYLPLYGVATLCPAHVKKDTLCEAENWFQPFIVETVVTFVFVNLILNLKFQNGNTDILNAFSVAFCLFGMIATAVGVSGAAINPAVGLIQPVFQDQVYRGFSKVDGKPELKIGLDSMWIYIVAPSLGGILAALWHRLNAHAVR